MTALEFWNEYLESTYQSAEQATYSGELVFEQNGLTGSEQLRLVKNNTKRACFTLFDSFQINMESIPVSGATYIVEDFNENPCCIIKVDDVKILEFNDISWPLAMLDGEDQNLSEWRERTAELFKEEADLCGFEFSGNSKIVCEIFHLIYSPKKN